MRTAPGGGWAGLLGGLAGGQDDVADAEKGIVAGVGGVEAVFWLAHQGRGPQVVADLVDVQAFQVFVHGHEPDRGVLPPVQG